MGGFHPDPWQVKPPDGHRPVAMQTSVVLPGDASQSDAAVLNAVAGQIVGAHTNTLHHFVNGARQQNAITGRAYDDQSLSLEGLTARWRINNGQERLNLTLYPHAVMQKGSLVVDSNFDGYVAWVHIYPSFNIPMPPGVTYNILLNGYLVEKGYVPKQPVGGYPILFGKTALLCASYVGDVEHENPLIGDPSKQGPNSVVPANGWGAYAAGVAPNGDAQSAIAKSLGYWIFDWANVHNPCQYARDAGSWVPSGTFFGVPVFDKGMYFADARKSPLSPQGENGMAVVLVSDIPGGSEVLTGDLYIGEFYDRGAYRLALQSWVYGPQDGQVVMLNDKPCLFGSGSIVNAFGSQLTNLSFDLDPKVTGSTTDDDLIGPHDGVSGGTGPGSGMTDDEISQLDDWIGSIQQIYAAFVIAQKPAIDAASNKLQQAETTLTDDNLKYLQADDDLLSFQASYNADVAEYAVRPTQELLLDIEFFAQDIAAAQPKVAAAKAIVTQDRQTVDDDATTLGDLLNQTPQNLPPFPTFGKSIDDFTHSPITINGSTWDYNQ